MIKTVLTTHNRNGNVCGMNLSEFAVSKGGTGTIKCPVLAATAKKARCSAETLYLISKGHKQASAKLSNRIAAATNFAVAPREIRPDIFIEERGDCEPEAT